MKKQILTTLLAMAYTTPQMLANLSGKDDGVYVIQHGNTVACYVAIIDRPLMAHPSSSVSISCIDLRVGNNAAHN